jgi:SAM-dependent methyltransferase
MLTYKVYKHRIKELNDKYWTSTYRLRWQYMSCVLDGLKWIAPETSLEIGTNKINLLSSSDMMDYIDGRFDTTGTGRCYIQDARRTPWPFQDKQYDVVIALQVFEHLSGKQQEAFEEIKRISHACILSVPYNIPFKEGNKHTGIDYRTLRVWTGMEPSYKKLIGQRGVFYYKFKPR